MVYELISNLVFDTVFLKKSNELGKMYLNS